MEIYFLTAKKEAIVIRKQVESLIRPNFCIRHVFDFVVMFAKSYSEKKVRRKKRTVRWIGLRNWDEIEML